MQRASRVGRRGLVSTQRMGFKDLATQHKMVMAKPGGRQSVSGITATVFGATGFVGRYVVSRLGTIGSQVIVPYRGDGMNARHLKSQGTLGQIVPMPYDMFDEDSVRATLAKSNVVVNLIGSQHETRNFGYEDTNVKVTHRLAKLAKEAGVTRFIQMSHIGVNDADSKSRFLASKREAEKVARDYFPDAIVMRSAPIFGEEDYLLNTLAKAVNISPVHAYPLFNPQQVLAPVYVGDVSEAILKAILSPHSIGQTYHLAGPDTMDMKGLQRYVCKNIHRSQGSTLSIPAPLDKVIATVMSYAPMKWRYFNGDMVEMGKTNMVMPTDTGSSSKPKPLGFADLDVKPKSLDSKGSFVLIKHTSDRGPSRFDDHSITQYSMDPKKYQPAKPMGW